MDCRETQALLTAFHDGELPADDHAGVEAHLRGCAECGALLAGLARVDHAAGVPDPGPAYWDRFNARVMERIAREADRPGVTVPRPNGGWMRRQLRYLVPAAAAAALVVTVVRFGGMDPGTPAPTAPAAVSEPATPDAAGGRIATAEPEPDGQGWPGAGAGRDATGSDAPAPDKERFAAVTREERDLLADRPLPAGNVGASRDRAAAPAGIGVSSPPPTAFRSAPVGSPTVAEQQATGKTTSASGIRSGKESPAGSPCELARALAERKRIREAEGAQRACLAGDLDATSRENGLIFLAELLDRQTRFADADAVIAEVDRRYPQSRPLDLYRQQRPMVQQRPMTAPGTR
jgi:hypothetical protein